VYAYNIVQPYYHLERFLKDLHKTFITWNRDPVSCLLYVVFVLFICSIKILNSQNAGFFSYVINGINHVIRRARSTGRRSVISMSLIGPITESVNEAIREAVANNIVVVTAAGNFRRDSCGFSPSSSPDVINVGATQEAEDPNSRTPGKYLVKCLFELVWTH